MTYQLRPSLIITALRTTPRFAARVEKCLETVANTPHRHPRQLRWGLWIRWWTAVSGVLRLCTVVSFVSGCFDLLHSGHVEFLQQAARFGRLHVAVGSDRTVQALKGRSPLYTESERLFMINALSCVHSAFISTGSGVLDFETELRAVNPDVFVVNQDGDSEAKAKLCKELGIGYEVLKRVPHSDLPRRSTSDLRVAREVPYRIDLAGGWLDQPFVSRYASGSVVTACIEPTRSFDERSGLATSTRRAAVSLWDSITPPDDFETAARILFAVENPPGKEPIAGSQDAIGIVFPGFAKSDYSGNYWPDRITHERNHEVAEFIDDHIRLVPLGPRDGQYDVLSETNIDARGARTLATAAARCWEALLDRDLWRFGAAVTASFEAQIEMFPNMTDSSIRSSLRRYMDVSYGWKLCGSGGGGYIMLVTKADADDGIPIVVRR